MFTQFRVLEEAAALELASRLSSWSTGQARTKEVTGTIKNNQEIVAQEGDEHWEDVRMVRDAIQHHHGIRSSTLLAQMTVPKFNRYSGGGTYKRHFDASPIGMGNGRGMRTDFACTLFLNDDYEGGELHVETPEGGVVKPPRNLCKPGVAVVYECGSAHWVTPVTKGERICSVMWLRSLVRDIEQRRVLTNLTNFLGSWEREKKTLEPYSDEFTTLTGIQTALCRMWIE